MKKTIRDIAVANKVVFVRVDFNVPIKEGIIKDDNRIVQALPTIRYLVNAKAKVVLLSHLGKVDHKNPENTENDKKKNNMAPVAIALKKLLGEKINVAFTPVAVGSEVNSAVSLLKGGDVLLLQNTRFEKGEEKNDLTLAKAWADLADAFVMDAFGSAHRAHASTYGIPSLLKERGKDTALGFLVEKEVLALSKCVSNVERPYVAILGGAKVSDKIKVIEVLLDKVDVLIIGGGMSYTFAKAQGFKIGTSLLDEAQIDFAKNCLEKGKGKLLLPIDRIIANDFSNPSQVREDSAADIPDDFMGLDIGPKTRTLFANALKGAKTVFWNGPMGVFEDSRYDKGTIAICEAIANLKGAFTVIGGGDSAAATAQFGFYDKFSHVSTGGGASLEMIENEGHLPGIDVIEEKNA
ncbi:MAG: phosphoglycerate kinase [Bacillales bacterium]|jgi:phosphoglycerate kinase|nr:phosphoglycerate kinase [Bacillales bacterium]